MLSGAIKEYPIKIYDSDSLRDIEIRSSDELITKVIEVYESLSKVTDKVKISHALDKLCIGEEEEINSIQIADKRTLKILKMHEYYKNNPSTAFTNTPFIWFESVYMLNKLEPRGLF